VSSGRHAIYIAGISVFWELCIIIIALSFMWMIIQREFMFQSLMGRKRSNNLENTFITLSAQRSLSGVVIRDIVKEKG
jgi:hypothetical protein